MGVLDAAVQVVVFIALGVMCHKLKWTSDKTIGPLTKILLNISVPCMVINSMMTPFETEKLQKGMMALVMVLGIQVFFALSSLVWARILKPRDIGARSVVQTTILFNNFMIIGVPIIESVLGPEGLFYTGLMGLPQRIVMFSSLPIIYGRVSTENRMEKIEWKMLLQMPTIAVFIGLFLFITGIRPPEIIGKCISDLGGMTMPLGMMITGMQLVGVNVKELLTDISLPIVVLVKNIINPAIVLVALSLLGFPTLLVQLGVLFASIPTAMMTAVYAANYKVSAGYAGAIVFLSTSLGVLTMPFWSYIVTVFL